jgi:hypothetical protein
MRHRAHWVENKLFYKGRVVIEKAVKEEPQEPESEA